MPWIVSGILLVIIIILIVKQSQKIIIDKTEFNKYKLEIDQLRDQRDELENNIFQQRNLLQEYQEKVLTVQDKYKKELNKKSSDLDNYFINQKQLRQSELDTEFERQERERKENLDLRMRQFTAQAQERVNKAEIEARHNIERWEKAQQDIADVTAFQEERFESLLAPLRQYEMEKQERLFYTIQVPDEYKQDIAFLLNTVTQKIQHPDVINKLIWVEYVKPYIDETFKRANIKDEPGIYKLTNIDSGKCYIGKSTNIKKRIADHFKSSVGIKTIADQAIHHEILNTGFWNWTIEAIIYCDKKELNDLEKYYIQFFKSNIFGFNKTGGGEG